MKFHGSYEQFDRDTATARKQRGDDKEWQFMVRVRPTGGAMTADQYLTLDRLADRYSNGTLRITTRSSMQFHGVLRENLKATVAEVNHALLTTTVRLRRRGAAGDGEPGADPRHRPRPRAGRRADARRRADAEDPRLP